MCLFEHSFSSCYTHLITSYTLEFEFSKKKPFETHANEIHFSILSRHMDTSQTRLGLIRFEPISSDLSRF